MDAIILAGGFGTRLRPLTLGTPKPLVPVANRPFLLTLLWRLSRSGVKQAVLSTFHQASQIRKAIKSLPHFGMQVAVVEEKQPLGTGGAIRYAWPKGRRECLVLNGDVLSDFEMSALAAFHSSKRSRASLWVRPVEDVSAFGVLEFDGSKAVQRFLEKPKPSETQSRSINAGVYLLSPEVLEEIPEGRAVSVEREIFPRLVEKGLGLYAYDGQAQAYWRDIGTPAHYLQANLDAVDGKLSIFQDHGGIWPKANGNRSLVAKECKIPKDCKIDNSVVNNGCRLGKNCQVLSSVLWEGCQVGEGAKVEGAILGRKVKIGAYAEIKPGSVIGDHGFVPDYSRV